MLPSEIVSERPRVTPPIHTMPNPQRRRLSSHARGSRGRRALLRRAPRARVRGRAPGGCSTLPPLSPAPVSALLRPWRACQADGRRRLRVHGKGGNRHTPIPTEELRQELAELSLRRDPQEHLLYPQKRGPKGTIIWENRLKGLSGPALHRWWYRCRARAGVVDEGTTRGKKLRKVWANDRKSALSGGLWRRRESNPRPRSHRTERLRA
jgi:hypothetical protein